MKKAITAVALLGLVALPVTAMAGTSGRTAGTSEKGAGGGTAGSSKYAPGKQTTPGTAKDYAPGQKQTTPGSAKTYAPGQQDQTTPKKK